MDAETVLNHYRNAVQDACLKRSDDAQRAATREISAVAESCAIPDFDWAHSPELVETWAQRVFSGPAMDAVLLRCRRLRQAEAHTTDVLMALEKAGREGVRSNE